MKKEIKQEGQKTNEESTKLITFNGQEFKLLRYQDEWVFPMVEYYSHGLGSPIVLSLHSYNMKENEFEPYTDITVNLPDCKRSAGCQFIDTNNNDPSILDWLEKNDFGYHTGKTGQSGFCTFPEFNFYAGKQFMEYKALCDKLNGL